MATGPVKKQEPSLSSAKPAAARAAANPTPAQSKTPAWIYLLLAVVLLSPALIGGFWWVRENPVSIPELQPNLPPAPGFLDVGLLKREIITGDIVQVNIVIRTETKADAELLKHHLNDLRRAAIDIVGRQYGKEIAEYEGKRDLSRTLKIGFQEVIDRDRADLVKGVVFTDFLIIQ